MTAYVNPTHGHDALAVLNDRSRPFKTHAAAQLALDALEQKDGHYITTTHKEPPPKKRLRRPRVKAPVPPPEPEPTP